MRNGGGVFCDFHRTRIFAPTVNQNKRKERVHDHRFPYIPQDFKVQKPTGCTKNAQRSKCVDRYKEQESDNIPLSRRRGVVEEVVKDVANRKEKPYEAEKKAKSKTQTRISKGSGGAGRGRRGWLGF